MTRLWLLLLGLVWGALAAGPAWAGRPYVRQLTSDEGLVLGEIYSLAQDDNGFIWFGGYAGVSRWNGRRVEKIDHDRIRHRVRQVVLADGAALGLTFGGEVWWAAGPRTRRAIGPDGTPLRASAIGRDRIGRVLVISRGALYRLREGRWEFLREHATLRGAIEVAGLSDGSVALARGNAVYRLPIFHGDAELLTRVDVRVGALLEGRNGNVLVGAWSSSGHVVEVDPRGETVWEDRFGSGVHGLALDRTGGLWVGMSRGLVYRRPDGEVDRFLGDPVVHVGGTVMVDREGTLWIGTYEGVSWISAPHVRRWGKADGLVVDLSRDAFVGKERVYVSNWNQPGWIDPDTDQADTFEGTYQSKGRTCEDGTGMVWALRYVYPDGGDWGHILGFRGTDLVVERPARLRSTFNHSCDTDAEGSTWMTAGTSLYELRGDEIMEEHPFPGVHPRNLRGRHTVNARDGEFLWVTAEDDVCFATRSALRAHSPDWTCERLPEPGRWITSLERSVAGRMWAGSLGGLYVRDEDGSWQRSAWGLTRPSAALPGLGQASEGGLWVAGQGTVVRIRDRPDLELGAEILQDLTGWLGPQVATIFHVHEGADGTLWIVHSGGVTQVPIGSRHPDLSPPPISFVERRVDGQPVESDSIELPERGSVVRLHASSPSYLAPRLLRFRSRLDDSPWSESVPEGVFELKGLAPGAHVLEVAASLDGVRWTEPPARSTILVPNPWYARVELWVVGLVLLGISALGWQRVRSGIALREERLRTRMAMDLHDEVGAGLGAIGLLGSVLRRDLKPDAVRSVGEDIVEASGELSHALRAIVWSLQPSSQSLGALGEYLADRARLILPELHEQGGLAVHIDEGAGAVPLRLEELRATQLIGIEALHNIAKHAHASHVRLEIARQGRSWSVFIDDDGVGIDPEAESAIGHGYGLEGMERRAASIGASLIIGPRPSGGTRIGVSLPPRRRRIR